MLCGAALLLQACGTLTTWSVDPTMKTGAETGDLAQTVDRLARPLITQGQAPGMVIGLQLADGSSRFYSYGTTQKDGGEPVGPDTLFAVGSLSKGFLSGIASTLVQDGKMSWSDDLASLLPPGTPLSEDAARITADELATHTSGLPRQPPTLRTLSYFVQYLFTGDNFYRHLDRTAVLDYLADYSGPSVREPQYSNIGYGILTYGVECRSGQSIDALLAERITGPLGLTETSYEPETLAGYAHRALGHAGDQPKFIHRGEPVPDWRMTDILRGSAALYSTARDLLTFAGAHIRQDGSPLSIALADNLRIRFPRPREAAAAAWIADDVEGLRIIYQVGLIAGYTSYVAVDPQHHTAAVVLQNAFNWDYSLGHNLMLMLAAAR